MVLCFITLTHGNTIAAAASMVELPVIDLQLVSARPDESARLRDACERLGCFRVSGHRVPAALQANMKAAVCALFDLPDDAKRRNTDTVADSGYIAPNPINPLYESLGLWDAALAADIDAFCSRLDAPPHARETVKRYVEEMHDLVVDVASKVAGSLGLDQLDQFQFQDWPCQFRMNKYNYTQDTVGCQGVQTHTDSGFLTVIQEDDCVGGLEVLDPAINEFVPVDHPLPGTFVINVGDVGKAWTNGRIHNVKHRVQCVAAVPRISMAMSLLAPRDDMVCAPEGLVDADHPRRFKDFNYQDYRKLRRSNEGHTGGALAQLAA